MVGGFNIATNGIFKFTGRAMRASTNLLFGQRREPALDQVEPGSAGGREVQVKTRMAGQPAMNQRSLVRRVIVQDQMNVQSCGYGRVDAVQKFPELDRPMAQMKVSQHPSALHFQGREQRGTHFPDNHLLELIVVSLRCGPRSRST